jgi:hypothetical protein
MCLKKNSNIIWLQLRQPPFKCLSEWLLLNTKWAIFQLHNGETKVYSVRWWCLLCNKAIRFCLFGFFGASLLKQQTMPIDISLNSDTLSRFWANQSSFFLLIAVCLVEDQEKSILRLNIKEKERKYFWIELWDCGVKHHFQQYFSYIVAASFTGCSL